MQQNASSPTPKDSNASEMDRIAIQETKDALVRAMVTIVNSDAICISDINALYEVYHNFSSQLRSR